MEKPQCSTTVADYQARFWNGPVTRKEIQAAFDDYTRAAVQMQETLIKLDLTLAYLLERFEVTPEQVQGFVTKKMQEYAAQQAAQAAQPTPAEGQPAPTTTQPLVTL